MTNAWTNIPKPTDATYTNINVQGREQYDQANLTYDDANTFYDGVDMAAWVNVNKPALPMVRAGIASGLIMPLTFPTSVLGTQWTPVNKPIT